MKSPGRSYRAIAAGPAEVVDRFRDLLPLAVSSHPRFGDAMTYLHGLDPDIAAFHYFIEWNLRDGEIDLTFTLPTTFAKQMRLPFSDLAQSLGRGAGAERGRRLVVAMSERLRSLPLDAPLFPRAVSFSLGAIGAGGREAGVELLFLDFGPSLDLAADPGLLRRAFELIAPNASLPGRDDTLAVLQRVAVGLDLAHVGAGSRHGKPLHKVYLGGRLDELVRAAVDRGAVMLVGPCACDLERLACATGHRAAHLVLDAVDGRLTRAGFELNFHLDRAEGFAQIALADPLWAGAVQGEARRDAERLIELGTAFRRLPDGSYARLRISHLKISFDGSGAPEWKAYLCFQRTLAAG
jgi:hypothetical protein